MGCGASAAKKYEKVAEKVEEVKSTVEEPKTRRCSKTVKKKVCGDSWMELDQFKSLPRGPSWLQIKGETSVPIARNGPTRRTTSHTRRMLSSGNQNGSARRWRLLPSPWAPCPPSPLSSRRSYSCCGAKNGRGC